MTRLKLVASVLSLLLSLTAVAQNPRGPSTPAERERLVKLAGELQTQPLDPSLDSDRQWAMKWIQDIPDITINLCPPIYAPMKDAPHGNLLAEIFTISATAFMIEHPDQALLDVDVNLAGMTGMLKAYQTIIKNAPRQSATELDNLLDKQKAGTLEKFISDQTMKCSTNPRS